MQNTLRTTDLYLCEGKHGIITYLSASNRS
ncbi:hypothetical protein ABID39_000307 [Bartonella japonica]|uniref:Uncharacterized protein n=1 Tax=Bartonella japonica TaxID=357761 RepID=A0ABV2FM76_9HYPH